MRLVRQAEERGLPVHNSGAGGRRRGIMGIAVLVLAAIASGCATPAQQETGGRGGAAAVKEGNGQGENRTGRTVDGAAGALLPPAEKARRAREAAEAQQAARAVAAKRWGLVRTPLAAPAPPAVKPRIGTRKGFEVDGQVSESLPPVFTTVPVKERVVFLTIDDGAEKDPELIRMMDELKIPYSAFLADYVVKEDYGYFKKMQDKGVALHNHTLNHRYLPGLSYRQQKKEICGQQTNLERRYGTRPPLFRPPFGNYNKDTLRAAKTCGVKAVPLWAAEAFPDRMEWREWDKDLHPGDIVLTHFRGPGDWKGSMPDMIRRVMKTITAKGYAVAKLEDYV
ncbi:polysaccharide deacetylase family protein [Streptomyces sp. CA-294286]|uniref:polysaccharide deacetylase family protein n=1 Tax=Streptomyces sp. CA-294286 TaxID=3240070 RepID=UPI003D8FB6F7